MTADPLGAAFWNGAAAGRRAANARLVAKIEALSCVELRAGATPSASPARGRPEAIGGISS